MRRIITKRLNVRALTFLLLVSVVGTGAIAGLKTTALATGQNNSQSKTRTPAHPRKHISVSCKQLCIASYDDCRASGAKKGVHSCKRVYNECLQECATGQ